MSHTYNYKCDNCQKTQTTEFELPPKWHSAELSTGRGFTYKSTSKELCGECFALVWSGTTFNALVKIFGRVWR